MNEPQREDLVGQLRRSNRRWKMLALGTLAALVLGLAFFVTYAAVQASRARAAEAAARMEADRARGLLPK
jgi:hypothetical protein